MQEMTGISPADTVLPSYRLTVSPDWIDTNRHMNAAYYTLAVKDAAMAAHEEMDYGLGFRRRTGQSNFVLDSRVVYLRELLVGTPLLVRSRLLHFDRKRQWMLFEIRNEAENYLAALVRYLMIHVEMGPPPRSMPIPDDLRERLRAARDLHATVPLPDEARRFDRKELFGSDTV